MSGEAVDLVGTSANEYTNPIVFSPLNQESGLCITDQIDRRQYVLRTPAPVVPKPADSQRFPAPIDAAVQISTDEITLGSRESVFIRNESGQPIKHTFDEDCSCPRGSYVIDVTTHVKLYFHVEAPVTVRPSRSATVIDFGRSTTVAIGARSSHRRPAGTITTTNQLEDVREAITALSSSLMTCMPERSFPTLRGHPPRIRLGTDLDIPAPFEPQSSEITLEVQNSITDLLVAAPLAFYLGANLQWGERQLVAENGVVYSFSSGDDFENDIGRVLKQTFFLDCLTRTEGLYPLDLYERRVVDNRTDIELDFERLYHLPISKRVESYIGIPYRKVADLIPKWSAAAYVEPEIESVTALPYLLDRLSTVRITGPQLLKEFDGPEQGFQEFVGIDTRSAKSADLTRNVDNHLVLPDTSTALTTTWVGEGVPLGATKALEAGFEHRLEREPTTDDIRIQVVYTESGMEQERESVRAIYQTRRDRPFDVDVRMARTTDELRTFLERETDFFHFIGHVDSRGFRCGDGWLDASECETIGADAFLLNSCRSYGQGEQLIRKGAVAGIVTVTDLLNHHAAAIGRTLAQFLNYGFPLYAALDVVREEFLFGEAYTVLGDAYAVLSQSITTTPEYVNLMNLSGDIVSISHHAFPTHQLGIGVAICPAYEEGILHYLRGNLPRKIQLSVAELEELLELQMPLREGSDLRFSLDDVSESESRSDGGGDVGT